MARAFWRSSQLVACGASLALSALGCQTTSGPPRPLFGGGDPSPTAPSGVFRNDSGPIRNLIPHPRVAPKAPPADSAMLPKELNKVTMPPYMVEAPDILLIDAKRLIPLPPYKIAPLDVLYLRVPESINPALPDRQIDGPYPVQPDGTVDLGPDAGAPIKVADLLVNDAAKVIEDQLRAKLFKDAKVTASLAQSSGAQQIRGEHLIQPDGTVALGLYGSVYVAGMTTPQVKQAIENHLSQTLYKPEVSVSVSAFNSKYYYVITDFAGAGTQVQRIPSTGNETVLDAISFIGGLSQVSSNTLWIARPAPDGVGDQILPVDWKGITRRGLTGTNYQVLPGDRVFVMGQPLTKVDSTLARVLAPIDRAFGSLLLGSSAVQQLNGNGLFGNNNRGGTTNVLVP